MHRVPILALCVLVGCVLFISQHAITTVLATSVGTIHARFDLADVPTEAPPTSEPPTSEPPTSEPPTSEPPTSEPPTSEPPTSEPPQQPTDVPTTPPDNGDGDEDDPEADPRVVKSVNTGSAQVGDLVEYTYTVTVVGNTDATGVIVEDTFPFYLEIVEATTTKGQIVINGQTVGAWIGNVSPGEEVTVRVVVRVLDSVNVSSYTNTVVLTTTSDTDDPSNNTSSTTIVIPGGGVSPTPTPTATFGPGTPSPTPEPGTPSPVTTLTALPVTPTPAPLPDELPITGTSGGNVPASLIVMLILALGTLGSGLVLRRWYRR